MKSQDIQLRNARFHIIEGALYLSTNSLISTQTTVPALIKRLGGNDILVGTWPVVYYLAMFLPQIISANYSTAALYRKPTVILRGFLQRLNIFALACAVGFFGISNPEIALVSIFLFFVLNQLTIASVSPIWMDFFAKTTHAEGRGRIIGWRASSGALIGLLNGFIMTLIFTVFKFPFDFASIIGLAFIYQMCSLAAQKKVVEASPSTPIKSVRFQHLFRHARQVIAGNLKFRRFLYASALLTISFSAAAFFTVSAMKRLDLPESIIGIFTIVTIVGQIISGIFVGWIADTKGTKAALIVCAGSLILAIIIAIFAQSVIWFCLAFIFMGVNVGSELSMRYNYAVECAPEADRSMYVGLMNTWFAPFYLITPFAGWLSVSYGHNSVFIGCLIIAVAGIIHLIKMPETESKELALSSK